MGHVFVIPFRHTPDFFTLTDAERKAAMDLVVLCKGMIKENFFHLMGILSGSMPVRATRHGTCEDIRFRIGEAVGLTVFPCHVIFRYGGDVPDARGGVWGGIDLMHIETTDQPQELTPEKFGI